MKKYIIKKRKEMTLKIESFLFQDQARTKTSLRETSCIIFQNRIFELHRASVDCEIKEKKKGGGGKEIKRFSSSKSRKRSIPKAINIRSKSKLDGGKFRSR